MMRKVIVKVLIPFEFDETESDDTVPLFQAMNAFREDCPEFGEYEIDEIVNDD